MPVRLERVQSREHQLEADADVVGDERHVGPLVLADLVVEPLDDELARRGRLRSVLRDRDGNDDVVRGPFQLETALRLEAAAAERRDRARLERRARELAGVEPRRAWQLDV